jgi:hypothetical protein
MYSVTLRNSTLIGKAKSAVPQEFSYLNSHWLSVTHEFVIGGANSTALSLACTLFLPYHRLIGITQPLAGSPLLECHR